MVKCAKGAEEKPARRLPRPFFHNAKQHKHKLLLLWLCSGCVLYRSFLQPPQPPPRPQRVWPTQQKRSLPAAAPRWSRCCTAQQQIGEGEWKSGGGGEVL